jgi:alpha-L-rhamnosidase
VPVALRAATARHLADQVIADGRRLTTGFLGSGLLCPVLAETGRADLAFDLLLDERIPSWLGTVGLGATTIWERWDGWTPEAGFASPNMNSFNHYAFGAVVEWLYTGVAGLAQADGSAGYERLRIAPLVDPRLGFVHARHDSVRGPVAAGWTLRGDELLVDVELPPGTSATVHVPGDGMHEVAAGTHRFRAPWGAPHPTGAAAHGHDRA